jgi:hypothetical protein
VKGSVLGLSGLVEYMSMTSCCAAKLMNNVVHVEVEDGIGDRGDIVTTDTDPATDINKVFTTEADSSEKSSENTISSATALEKAKPSQLGCCCKATEPLPSEAKTEVIAPSKTCCTQGSGDNIAPVKPDKNNCGINNGSPPLVDEGWGSEVIQGNSC